MGFLCARLCINGTTFLRPPANQKFIWKRIERFFLNLYLIIHTLNATFWAKKIWRPVNPCKISKANFFKKWTFFKNFGIFRISSMSWLEKWSYFFNLMNFVFWHFSARARQLKLENPMGKCENMHIFAHFGQFLMILKQILIFQIKSLVFKALCTLHMSHTYPPNCIETYTCCCNGTASGSGTTFLGSRDSSADVVWSSIKTVLSLTCWAFRGALSFRCRPK